MMICFSRFFTRKDSYRFHHFPLRLSSNVPGEPKMLIGGLCHASITDLDNHGFLSTLGLASEV